MKRIILFLLITLSLSANAQNKKAQFFYFLNQQAGGGAPSTAIASVTYDFDKIYYYQTEAIALSATPNVSVTNSSWQVRDMETDALVGLSFGNSASFTTITTMGFYRIIYEATTATDKIHQEWDDILILDKRFTRAEANQIIDMSAGNHYEDFASADKTGWKIWIENNGTGYMYLGNLWGTAGLSNYVRIQSADAGFIQTGVAGSTGLGLSGGRYIIVDGHFANKDVGGYEIRMPVSAPFDVRLAPDTPFTNIIFTGLKLNRQGYEDAAAFSLIAGYDQTWNALTWVVEGMAIHDCWIENSGAEAIYYGFTDDRIFTGSPDFRPVKFRKFIVAWNTIINAGNDGIQPCNSLEHRIHDNYINTCGVALNQYHETGISYNAGSSGRVYNNFIKNVKIFITLDSGLSPVDLYAGSTTVQKSQFYNNVFVNGTPPAGGVTETISIYGQLRAGYLGAVELPWEFFNNTFVSSKILANFYFETGGFVMPNFKFFNNIILKQTDTGGDFPELDYIGPGTKPSASDVVNNLVYTNGSESPVLFTNAAGDNYRPSSLSSTAFTGSPEDVSTKVTGINFADADGMSMTDYYGAYSRMDLRTVDPTPSDAAAATFSVAPAVGSLTNVGGTFSFEANKVGLCYYVVVPDGNSPSIAQILAGQNSSGGAALASGNVLDPGTALTQSFTGLTENTAYDLWAVFKTQYGVLQASPTKADFTTTTDTTKPTLSGWEITNANPNRLYFNSSEVITATTYGGFTIDRIIGTTVTVTGVTINTGNTTGHYFSLSENVEAIDYLARIAYSGSGSNLQDAAGTPNTLASFAATLITNNVTYSKRIKINISNSANYVGTTDWNDVNLGGTVGVKTLIANVKDDTNTNTGFVYAITNAFNDFHNTANATAGTYISDANAIVRGIEVYNGGDNAGTLRLSGLTSTQAFEMIYLIKNTFGTGAGNVNVNGAGAVGYTTGTVERKVVGNAVSGNIDYVMTQSTSNTAEVLVAVIIIVK